MAKQHSYKINSTSVNMTEESPKVRYETQTSDDTPRGTVTSP